MLSKFKIGSLVMSRQYEHASLGYVHISICFVIDKIYICTARRMHKVLAFFCMAAICSLIYFLICY